MVAGTLMVWYCSSIFATGQLRVKRRPDYAFNFG